MRRFASLLVAGLLAGCTMGPQEDGAPSDPTVQDDILMVPGLARYIGVWESEDGQLRQAFVTAEGGASVNACMTAPDENGAWRRISEGRYVADGEEIRGSFTGQDMGFERLDVVGYPIGRDGEIDWVNTAVTGESQSVSYETWSPPSAGVFTFVIERGEGVERELWFAGQWRFRNDLEAVCD